jgi:hypothetical protein
MTGNPAWQNRHRTRSFANTVAKSRAFVSVSYGPRKQKLIGEKETAIRRSGLSRRKLKILLVISPVFGAILRRIWALPLPAG